jgi:hypothetical protein
MQHTIRRNRIATLGVAVAVLVVRPVNPEPLLPLR